MMCAMVMVQKPSEPGPMVLKNSAVKVAPMTTSGAAIGRNSSKLMPDLARKRCRTMAKAIIVPRMVAARVATRPISTRQAQAVAHARCWRRGSSTRWRENLFQS